MAFEHEKRQARRILESIEGGMTSVPEAYNFLEPADPTLIYFIFTWLRANYPASHPAADGVLGRLGELVSRYPALARKAKAGSTDGIVTWFEEAYSYKDFKGREFVDLVVEKLEG